mgnify:CR=1 FL=1
MTNGRKIDIILELFIHTFCFSSVVYMFCFNPQTCVKLTGMVLEYMSSSDTQLGRRRNIHMCDICCGDDLCNSGTCHELKRKLLIIVQNTYFFNFEINVNC